MTVVELLSPHFERLHEDLELATQDLAPGQLHWRPSEDCNHIAFSLWHYVRTEDNLIRFVLQDRRTPVWLEQGWNERFGLERVTQGTGMSSEDAAALRLPPVKEFLPYMQAVWQSTHEYLGSVTDDDLQKVFTVRPFGGRPAVQVLMENLLTHGFSHLGEMWVLRGLQGLKGSPI
jgi:hypothetical protein